MTSFCMCRFAISDRPKNSKPMSRKLRSINRVTSTVPRNQEAALHRSNIQRRHATWPIILRGLRLRPIQISPSLRNVNVASLSVSRVDLASQIYSLKRTATIRESGDAGLHSKLLLVERLLLFLDSKRGPNRLWGVNELKAGRT